MKKAKAKAKRASGKAAAQQVSGTARRASGAALRGAKPASARAKAARASARAESGEVVRASGKKAAAKRAHGEARAARRPSGSSSGKPLASEKSAGARRRGVETPAAPAAAAPSAPAAQAKARASAAGSEPKLLSGGNPQVPKGDGDAPVQAYIAAMPGWKRDVGQRLDALVTRAVPHVRKATRWNSPFYGVEGQGWFFSFHCFARYVKLTFLRAASLRPPPPVASKYPDVRYFHIHEDDAIDEKLLVRWLEQASKVPGDPLF